MVKITNFAAIYKKSPMKNDKFPKYRLTWLLDVLENQNGSIKTKEQKTPKEHQIIFCSCEDFCSSVLPVESKRSLLIVNYALISVTQNSLIVTHNLLPQQ